MNLSVWLRVFRVRFGLAAAFWIFAEGVLLAAAMPLVPILLSTHIGLDKNEVTIYFLMTTLLGIVVTLGTGFLSDGAIARYKLVGVGGLIAAVGYFGIAQATQPTHAYIAGGLMIGLSVLFPQLFAVAKAGVVADWSHADQTTGITALRTFFSLGYVLGTALGSALVRVVDIQIVFMLLGGAVVGLTIGSALFLIQIERYIADRAVGDDSAETDAHEKPKRNQPISLPYTAMIVPLLALIVLRGADSTRGVYLSLVMLQLFNDAGIGPMMFGITAAAELITMAMVSELAGRIGERDAIAVGALFGAVYFIVLSFSQSLPLLYFMHIIYAVFVAALLGVAMAYVQRMVSARAGLGGSLYLAVFNIGSLVGILSPLLVTGYSQEIFIIPAILCVVGALMLHFGDRTAQVEQRIHDARLREAALEAAIRDAGVASAVIQPTSAAAATPATATTSAEAQRNPF